MRQLIHSLLGRLGFSVHRSGRSNRFDAMEEVLQRLHRLGYQPLRIIDGGSNVGQWATIARRTFPSAHIDLVEPQEGCQPALAAIAAADPAMALHPVALASIDHATVSLSGVGSSGAWVARPGQRPDDDAVEVITRSLDSLFDATVQLADRLLLKLDLEGYELEALAGGPSILCKAEAVVIEVSFYADSRSAKPVFNAVHKHMSAAGFHLFDIVALGDRARDGRLRTGDLLYIRQDSPCLSDCAFA
jgi:FkbM family methyltransferase